MCPGAKIMIDSFPYFWHTIRFEGVDDMLDNFIFSINAVVPIFLVLFLGFTLRKTNFLSEEFVASGNKLMFFVALPASLFNSIYRVELGEFLDWRFAAFVVAISVAGFFVIWFIAAFFIKDKRVLGAFVQGAFRANIAFLAIPLMINLAGDAGVPMAALLLAFVLPVYNVCSVLVLAVSAGSGHKVGFTRIFRIILLNPFIVAIFLAVGAQLLNIELPFIIDRSMQYTANMATPLALICLGAGMTFHGFDARFKYALIASLVKVIVLPVAFVAVGYFFGFRGYDLAAIMVLGGIPAAIAGYATVVQMGGDIYTAGTIVVISTFFSAFTLTLFIYLMRVLGLLA